MLVALKLNDSIYNMLKNLRTGNASFLIDMSNQYYRGATRLGETKQGRGAFTYLNDASRRAVNIISCHCLY